MGAEKAKVFFRAIDVFDVLESHISNIYIKNLDNELVYANNNFLNFLNFKKEEIIGKQLDVLSENSCTLINKIDNIVKEKLELIKISEIKLTYKNGKQIYITLTKKPLFDEKNNFIGLMGFFTDFTKIKKLENKIEKETNFLNKLLDNVEIPIYIKGKNNEVMYTNETFLILCGLTKKEVLNKTLEDCTHKKIYEIHKKLNNEVIKKNKKITKEIDFINRNGLKSRILITKTPFQYKGEKAVLNFGVDITKVINLRRKLLKREIKLQEKHKLKSISNLLINIAHNWRQPLAVVSMLADNLKMKIHFDNKIRKEEIESELDKITKNIVNISNYIEKITTLTTESNSKKIDFFIKETVYESEQMNKIFLENKNIFYEINILDDIKYYGNKFLLLQIVNGICINALEAFEKKDNESQLKYIKISIYKEKNNAVIEIIDNAGGIDDAKINKIFEPYYSTKSEKYIMKEAGLGLYFIKRYVQEKLNGKIKVKNKFFENNGKIYFGACFKIKFPINKKENIGEEDFLLDDIKF